MQGKKVLKFIVLSAFVLFLSSNAGGVAKGAKNINPEDVLSVKIPASWGLIRDSYNSGTDKLIVNIQDAHCDALAQTNISKIIDRLASDYNFKVVALEGASGKVQNPVLSFFPQENIKKEVSMYLVKEGKLTGAEHIAITGNHGLKLYGVEDIRLYMDNLEAFQQSQPFKEEAKVYFADLKLSLDKLKPYIYNEGLKEYDALEDKYASRKISFDEYVVALFRLMQRNGLNKIEYPTFFELQKAVELEAKVDFKKADVERTNLITELAQLIIDKKDIADLVEKSLNFKKGVLSAGEFAGYLKDLAFKMKLNMAEYPSFSAYQEFITKYEQVANENLFSELKQIDADLKNALYTDNDQRQLDVLYKNLDALNKLVDLKMINEDIEYFFENRAQMNSEEFRKFIEPQGYKHKLSIKLPMKLSLLDIYIPAWAKFYELADMRDIAFIEKTLKYMDEDDADYAALITGGFHTEQLTKILKSKKISYIVITPRASDKGDSTYINIMQGGKTKMEVFLAQLQSTLGMFIPGDQETLEESSLSDVQVADLQAKKQEKLEHHVASIAAFMAADVIANSDTSDGIDWANVKTEVKAAISVSLEKSGISGDQNEHLGAIVDNVINGLEKQENQGKISLGDGTLSIDFSSDDVLVYNPSGTEGNKITVAAKSDAGKTKVFASSEANLTLAVGTPAASNADTSGEETLADIVLSKMESLGMSFDDKVKVSAALNETAGLFKSGNESNSDLIDSLVVKLEDAGLSDADISEFISAIVVADTNLESNPVVLQTAKQVAVVLGKESTDTELMSTLQTGIAKFISSPAAQKQAVVEQLASQLNVDAGTLGDVINAEITVASLSVNPVVTKAASQIALKMDITINEASSSKLQAGVARVMNAPAAEKQTVVEQLAKDLNVNAQSLGEVIDTEIRVAGLSVNPVIIQSSKQVALKTELDDTNVELMATLQTGIARVMSAPVGSKQAAVEQLANEVNLKADTLGGIIDAEVSTTTLASGSTTVEVAKQLAKYLGITDPEVIADVLPILQSGIAGIMMSQPDAISEMADAINKVAGPNTTNAISLGKLVNFNIGNVNLGSNPITIKAAEQVVQELGLDSSAMPLVQTGVAEYMAAGNTIAKAKVADKLVSQINNKTGVVLASVKLTDTIDAKINSANIALNPVTANAADNLANELGISDTQKPEVMPVLQTGIANIMLAVPEAKKEATQQLAKSIENDLSSPIETGVLGNKVDNQISTASIAGNPVVVMASEQIAESVGIGEAQKTEMLPLIQTGAAKIFSAQTSEAKTAAMENLVLVLSSRPEVTQTKTELKNTINNSLAAASVTVTAEAAQPAQINVAQLSATADGFQGKLITEAGLSPQVVAKVKQNLAQQLNVGSHEGFLLSGQGIPQEIETPIKEAGFTGNVRVKIGASRKGQNIEDSQMKVTVLRAEDNSANITITFDNFNSKSKKEVTNIRSSLEKKEAGLLTADGSELLSVYSEALSPEVTKSNNKVERTAYSEKLKEMQGQVKFLAIDSTFFVSVTGDAITEEGIKAKLDGFISSECLDQVSKGRTTKFMITENESLSVVNESGEKVNVDLYSLIAQLGYSPIDFIVVDANVSAVVQNKENPQPVTSGVVMKVAENIAGKGNARVHYLAPENKSTQLAKFKSENSDKVTYSLFSPNVGANQIRNGDAFIVDALKVMIVGDKEMTAGDRKALAGAILATIKIDMSQSKVESLLGETFESTSMAKTINLKQDIELVVAAETWA